MQEQERYWQKRMRHTRRQLDRVLYGGAALNLGIGLAGSLTFPGRGGTLYFVLLALTLLAGFYFTYQEEAAEQRWRHYRKLLQLSAASGKFVPTLRP